MSEGGLQIERDANFGPPGVGSAACTIRSCGAGAAPSLRHAHQQSRQALQETRRLCLVAPYDV